MRYLHVTETELETLLNALEIASELFLDRVNVAGDDNDKEHDTLTRLESELLWQKAHNQRRPVQR